MPEEKQTPDPDDIPEFYIVTDVLDLHGFFPEQAPEMVEEFIRNARELNLTHLRIIHGKGKSKLKWIVRKVLEQSAEVETFYDAPPEIGGWGATLVDLIQEKDLG
ncbi:Smr/MutS family protein [candidate division KSB1 bacterium]|nr:Smr/MutS family protein [candidate division KSB1 bacterium]